MRNFKNATRIFWVGLAEMPSYFVAIKAHSWEVLWGAGVIGLPFTLCTLVWQPSWWKASGYILAAVVFLAGYHLWRDYHLRLQPKLKVTRVIPQAWRTAGMYYDKTPAPPKPVRGEGLSRDAIVYYFEIAGTSEAETVRDVRVQLSKIEPSAQNLDWLPVLLFHKHDKPPHKEKFDLNPGDVKHIDLVDTFRWEDHFNVRHIVDGVNTKVSSSGNHRLTVTITARDVQKVSVCFDVFMDSTGVLQCSIVEGNEP